MRPQPTHSNGLSTPPLSGGGVDAQEYAGLIERVRNDRYDESQGATAEDRAYRRGWNHGSRHVEQLIHAWIYEAVLEVSLKELAEVECLDLRLKHALIGGGV